MSVYLPVSSTALGRARTPPPAISPTINTAVVHIVKPCTLFWKMTKLYIVYIL